MNPMLVFSVAAVKLLNGNGECHTSNGASVLPRLVMSPRNSFSACPYKKMKPKPRCII